MASDPPRATSPEFLALGLIARAAELCALAAERQEQALRLCLKAEATVARAALIRAGLRTKRSG